MICLFKMPCRRGLLVFCTVLRLITVSRELVAAIAEFASSCKKVQCLPLRSDQVHLERVLQYVSTLSLLVAGAATFQSHVQRPPPQDE